MERVGFRFRKRKDARLREALIRQMEIEDLDASEIVRKALYMYLFNGSTYQRGTSLGGTPGQFIYPIKSGAVSDPHPESEEKPGLSIGDMPLEKIVLEEVEKTDKDLENSLDDILGSF